MFVDSLELGGKRRTPFVQQGEASECALACLAMVASYHGYETDLIALRRRFGISLKGATLRQVMQIAEEIGFSPRPMRGEIDDLKHVSLPVILHWDLNHFVVLTRISQGIDGKRYHLHDPARGVVRITREELSRHFSGVILELLKSETFVPRSEQTRLGITQLWSSTSGVLNTLCKVLVLSVILQIAALSSPFFLQISIDTVFPAFDRDLLFVLAMGFGGLAVINFMVYWLRSLVLVAFNNALSYQIIVNLFRHLMRLPLPWFEKRHVGDVISRFGSTQPIAKLLSEGLIAAVIDGAMALLTFVLMLVYSPALSALAAGALAIYIVIRIVFFRPLKLRNVEAIAAAAAESSALIESIRGIAAIKAFGKESNRQRMWQKAKAQAVNSQIRQERLTVAFDASSQLVLNIERVLFVYIAISAAIKAEITIGMIFAYQAYKQQFLDAGMRLVQQVFNYKIVEVHLSRVADIALSEPEEKEPASPAQVPDLRQEIEVKDVRYRYGLGEAEVLQGVSFTVNPGETVALVGPSGGGKTTLLKVMMGLFEPTEGQVLVGGRPITNFARTALRGRMGSIAQDDMLYAGSLAENIAFFDPDLDMKRVEEVARLAHIHDDIGAMPLRYETLVGDMGSTLSGGQKQRVLLARALYAQPDILFMDEGTAHLDPRTEASVLQAVAGLGITCVVIAHRTQSIEAADRIIFIHGQAQEIKPAGKDFAAAE